MFYGQSGQSELKVHGEKKVNSPPEINRDLFSQSDIVKPTMDSKVIKVSPKQEYKSKGWDWFQKMNSHALII